LLPPGDPGCFFEDGATALNNQDNSEQFSSIFTES